MTFRRSLIVTLLGVFGTLSLALSARAADDSAAFLAALRKRGMHDLALDYLETAAQDRLASEEFKQRIPFERGVTLMAKWRITPSASERRRLAAEVRSELEQFAKSSGNSTLAADAQTQLASLLKQTAERDLSSLEQRPGSPSKAAETRKRAGQNLQDARDLLTEVEKAHVASLKEFPKVLDPKTQSKEIEKRDQIRARLAQVRIVRSRLLHQVAETLEQDSKEAKEFHEKAALELQELYDKYSGYPIAFDARIGQGECYLALKKYKEATGCFEDVIAQAGENRALRSLVTKAMMFLAECFLEQEKYDAVEAKQGAWLAKLRDKASTDPGMLKIKFLVAEARRLQAELPETEEDNKQKLLAAAKELYQEVALTRNPLQKQAQSILLEKLGGGEELERPEPETFADALQAAKDAIASMNAAKQSLEAAAENNPDALLGLKEKAEAGVKDALHFLQFAEQLVDTDTPLLQRNEARWLTCGLMWEDEQYHRSAVLASFLARRYPEDRNAENAARVALASYQHLFNASRAAAGDGNEELAGSAEAARLKDLASFITRRWGATALAETAFGVLLNFSIHEKKFEEALNLVNELEPGRQPIYFAKIGNAMWETQLRASAQGDASIDRAAMQKKAIELLDSSFSALAEDPASRDTLAASSLYLAQAQLNVGQYAEAIKLLEDPKSGPIALTKSNSKIASRPVYAVEAYKSALRAYVSVVPPQSDKALATMTELESAVEKSGGGSEKLTRVYLGLGVQLQKQIEALQSTGKSDEAARVSEAFVAFLDKLNERGSSDPLVRRWIAQTYFKLAEGLEGNLEADELRSSYYAKAGDSFKALLDEGDAAGEDPNRLLALKLQYGQTLRRAENFAEALALFESILAEKEMMFEAQTAAAYTLQEWGASGNAPKFEEAVRGSGAINEKGKKIIWGWNRLSTMAGGIARQRPAMKDRFKDVFYECWLNIARIRLLKADQENGAEKKKLLKSARKVIKTMVEDQPGLLKTDRRDDYDKLAKEIQRAEGNPNPQGLKEFIKEE